MNKRQRKKKTAILWAIVFHRADAAEPVVMIYRSIQTARREFFKQVAYRKIPVAAVEDDGTFCTLRTEKMNMWLTTAVPNIQLDYTQFE